jgi:hypothetical protein
MYRSDAEYIPVLIAKTLNKGRKVVNIVTCDAEVGSGTVDAAGQSSLSLLVIICQPARFLRCTCRASMCFAIRLARKKKCTAYTDNQSTCRRVP